MGFSKGGGKYIFCPQNPATVLDTGAPLPFVNVFIGRDIMRGVLHGADVAAVNMGQGKPLWCCAQKSPREKGSSLLPTTQRKRCWVDTSWAEGTSGQFAWEHTQLRTGIDTVSHLQRQLSSISVWLTTLWIFSVSSRSSACPTGFRVSHIPLIAVLVQNHFHINPGKKFRELSQFQKTNLYDEFHGQTYMMNSVSLVLLEGQVCIITISTWSWKGPYESSDTMVS